MMRRKGFTLVELLVVMAVISILLGILIPTLINVRIAALKAAARSDINNLRSALAMYSSDWGCYPPSGNANMVEMLRIVPKDATSGTYMSFKAAQLVNGQFIDPFGRPYVYCLRGNDPLVDNADMHGNYYYIYSFGHNGEDESSGILQGWSTAENDENLLSNQPGDDLTSWY